MHDVPSDLLQHLRQHKQEHVLFGWDNLDAGRRAGLADQLSRIDLDEIARLYAKRDQPADVPTADRLKPTPTETAGTIDAATVRLGHEALARGELAVLLVAGG